MATKKKILFVYPTKNQLFVKPINYLAQHSTNEIYYVFEAEKKPEEFGKEVHFLHHWRKDFGINWINKKTPLQIPVPTAYKDLRSTIDKVNPDIVVAMDINALYFWQLLLWKQKYKLYLATEFKEHSKNPIYRNIGRGVLLFLKLFRRRVDKVLTFTKNAQDFWSNQGYQTKLLPAGVNTSRFIPKKTYSKSPSLLCIARMVPFKNHKDLLDAYQSLEERPPLTLVGDGVLYKQISQRAKSLGAKVIRRVDYAKIAKLYRDHEVLILPSSNEAIGMVVPEAMASGLATITSNTVGANTYVRKGVTGFIVKEHNVAALKTAIQLAVKECESLGRSGSKYVKEFDDQAIGKKYVEFFKN